MASFLTPPDLVIEIRSPGQTARELTERCAWCVARGVLLALLVDYRDETIRVFRSNGSVSLHRSGGEIAVGEIAPGARLAVQEIFAALSVDR